MLSLLLALAALPGALVAQEPAPAEDGNFLCTRSYGPGSTPLPCKPARDHWDSAFRHTFAITAWYPPGMHYLNGTADLGDVTAYAGAHFNMLFGGDGNIGCSVGTKFKKYQNQNELSPDQKFDCLEMALIDLRKLGLKLAFHPTDAGSLGSLGKAAGQTVGGAAGMGGITDSGPGSWSITAPEVAWVVGELERRNVSDVVAQIFFHDDEIGDSGATAAAVRWMRTHSPGITPQANTFSDSGPESLYRDGQFLFSAEQYAITGSDPNSNNTDMVDQQLIMFANDQLLAQRYRLDYWPLFALGDGGDVTDVTSDSLIRVQVYSAIAFGARGIYYYCWSHGVWNTTATSTGHPEFNYLPLANYITVKKSNADAAKFGTMLLDSRHVGSVRRASPKSALSDSQNGHSIAPGRGRVVEAMDDQLLVGVFSDGRETETGYLMVVSLQTSMTRGAVSPRNVTLTVNPACSVAVVPAAAGGWFAESGGDTAVLSKGTQHVTLGLQGGGGALLRITAGTGGCGQLLRGTRQWWYDPRTINLKHSYPETSLKSATYGGSTWMPQGLDSGAYTDGNVAGKSGNNEMTRDATGQGYGRGWCNERPCLPGRYRYFHKPGGLAGADSSFIIGGSQWEGGSAAVWRSDAEAKAWADAAFLMVSFPAEASAAALGNGMEWGTAHGIFTLLSAQLSGTVMDASMLVQLATNYSCHTNFAGFVLGSNFSAVSTDAAAVVKAADAMRSEAFWQLPLVLGVDSVDTAAKLGDQGIPLPAVQLNFDHTGSALEWARSTVGMLDSLASPAARNASITPAVSIDPCGTDSDSMMRFAAYTSVLLGGQALWWEGMGRCAPVGSPAFETVSSINNRVAQWAEPLFMRKEHFVGKGSWLADDVDDDAKEVRQGSLPNIEIEAKVGGQSVPPYGPTSFFIDAIFSTSSIKLPPLPGANGSLVHAQPPGGNAAALIQSMDPELIVVNLRNATSFGKNHTSQCKTAAGAQGQDCINYDSVLWIISTNLSTVRGGAPIQQLNISMHEDVWTTHPIEPEKYQGFSTDCNLAWLGPNMPLRLPGGSVQVVSYSIGPRTSSATADHDTHHRRVGRRAPSQWPGRKTDDAASALAPSLSHPSDELHQPPPCAALAWAARRGQGPRHADVYVDCDHGSDTRAGCDASSAVATLKMARSLVRKPLARDEPMPLSPRLKVDDTEAGKETAPGFGSKPHIVMVVVDDLGWHNVGWHNPEMITPNADRLVADGMTLDRSYQFWYCAPTRSSIMTGRLPYHVNQIILEDNAVDLNAPKEMTAMPKKLKEGGYATHMVGKWHVGLDHPRATPNGRGFDTSKGYLTAAEDHWTQVRSWANFSLL
jgi:hypothetical protein